MRGLLFFLLAASGTAANTLNKNQLNKPANFNSSIAIVGGGFSGLYTAYRLKKLGYQDITVFEKTSALGGKCQDDYWGRAETGYGTYGISYGYKWLMRTIVEMGIGVYDIDIANDPVLDEATASVLLHLVDRYESLRASEIGQSRDSHFLNFYNLTELATTALGEKSFKDWIDDNDLAPLHGFFNLVTAGFLYGPTTSLSAYHGLLWSETELLRQRITNLGAKVDNIVTPETGYQGLVETMAIRSGVKVVYNAKITNIKRWSKLGGQRCDTKCVSIKYKTPTSYTKSRETYDFLVSTIHPDYYEGALKFYGPEKRLFDSEKWITQKLDMFIVEPNDSNRGKKFDEPRMRFSKEEFNQAGLNYDFGLFGNRKTHVSDGSTVRFGGERPNHAAPRPRYWDDVKDTATFYFETVNQPISTDGVATKLRFDPVKVEELVKFTEDSWKIEPRDIKGQYQRDYLNRYTNEEIAKGSAQQLTDYSINNDRYTWFLGAYASFEALGKIADHVEVILEATGTKEKFEGPIFDWASLQ